VIAVMLTATIAAIPCTSLNDCTKIQLWELAEGHREGKKHCLVDLGACRAGLGVATSTVVVEVARPVAIKDHIIVGALTFIGGILLGVFAAK